MGEDPGAQEVSNLGADAKFVEVDLEVDFHSVDETGYVWTRLSDAREPSIVRPGGVLVIADGDALAMGRVVDLFEVDGTTFVHVDVLPGSIDNYLDYADRYAHATH